MSSQKVIFVGFDSVADVAPGKGVILRSSINVPAQVYDVRTRPDHWNVMSLTFRSNDRAETEIVAMEMPVSALRYALRCAYVPPVEAGTVVFLGLRNTGKVPARAFAMIAVIELDKNPSR